VKAKQQGEQEFFTPTVTDDQLERVHLELQLILARVLPMQQRPVVPYGLTVEALKGGKRRVGT
jgi:hypothetical protein